MKLTKTRLRSRLNEACNDKAEEQIKWPQPCQVEAYCNGRTGTNKC